MKGSGRCVVYMTAGGIEEAQKIAGVLVGRRLAACVNLITSVRSVYRWKGAVEDEPEVMLVAKTRFDKFDALRQAVADVHSYEVPEIIALPIVDGHEPYLKWIDESVGGEDE